MTLKPIYHAEQIISAYETAMGLPEAMRMTNDDGTFKAEATQRHIDKAYEKALAAAELPRDWNGLVDRMRDCLLVKELAVGETVPPRNHMAVPVTLTSGAASSRPLIRSVGPAPSGGSSSPWTTSPSTMCWAAMTAAYRRSTTASHTSALCWGNARSWHNDI